MPWWSGCSQWRPRGCETRANSKSTLEQAASHIFYICVYVRKHASECAITLIGSAATTAAAAAADADDAAAAVAALLLLCLDICCLNSVEVPNVCLHDCLHKKCN